MRTNRNRIVFSGAVVRRYPVHEQDRARIREHAQLQQTAHEAGLPVPEVLEVLDAGPEPCIVMPCAAGTPLMETHLDAPAQIRLAAELSEFLAALWETDSWPTAPVAWDVLWDALAQAHPAPETKRAAADARKAPVRPSHGDLSPGNLMVEPTGSLTAVLDWDAATTSDPATDFSALCANIPAPAAEALRSMVPGADALDLRAQAYLGTWGVQNELWLSDRHPWLSGHDPVSQPRF